MASEKSTLWTLYKTVIAMEWLSSSTCKPEYMQRQYDRAPSRETLSQVPDHVNASLIHLSFDDDDDCRSYNVLRTDYTPSESQLNHSTRLDVIHTERDDGPSEVYTNTTEAPAYAYAKTECVRICTYSFKKQRTRIIRVFYFRGPVPCIALKYYVIKLQMASQCHTFATTSKLLHFR